MKKHKQTANWYVSRTRQSRLGLFWPPHRCAWLLLIACFLPALAQAVETVCARVKIEIKQELTLERQAFDAQMKINNTTADGTIANVAIDVKVTDENGAPVSVTTDPKGALHATYWVSETHPT